MKHITIDGPSNYPTSNFSDKSPNVEPFPRKNHPGILLPLSIVLLIAGALIARWICRWPFAHVFRVLATPFGQHWWLNRMCCRSTFHEEHPHAPAKISFCLHTSRPCLMMECKDVIEFGGSVTMSGWNWWSQFGDFATCDDSYLARAIILSIGIFRSSLTFRSIN